MKKDNSSSKVDPKACREVASGVYSMVAGNGMTRANVYFVRSGKSWVLIDAGLVNCGQLIKKTAEALFGVNTPPTAILLTHDHPDHAGSALELARLWKCMVYLHPDELEIAVNPCMATFKKFANPMDKWIILPIMRMMPKKKFEAMNAKSSLKGVAKALESDAAVPGLPDWQCIPTPGHTPGHIAFFRAKDGVLITGDAIVTADLNSPWGMLSWVFHTNKLKMSGPPRYSTWNWRKAKASVAVLGKLKPRVIGTGHGAPMTGDGVAKEFQTFAKRFSG
jgi:glyoxylase-like metal-dependent hydrolase (beta-lactamase superfamily II)